MRRCTGKAAARHSRHRSSPAFRRRWSTSSRTPIPCSSASSRPSTAAATAPLFLVGDPKQAIYSFRNADLHTYLQARRLASAEHTLVENQRSNGGLIAAVNTLFGANPRAFVLDRPRLSRRARRREAAQGPARRRLGPPCADACVWTLPTDDAGVPIERRAAMAAVVERNRRRDRAAAARGARGWDAARR